MTKKSEQTAQNMPRGFDMSAGMVQHNLEFGASMMAPFMAANISILDWNANYCRQVAEGYSQWFDFLGHRLEEDATFAKQLQSTKDTQGLSNVCSKFFETAAKDYQTEFSELSKLPDNLAKDATDAAGQQNGP